MEHWEQFFKSAPAKQASYGDVKLTSTTETQADLDDAAAGRNRQERASEFTFTSVGPSLVLPDGSIEHGEIQVRTDKPPAKAKPADGLDLVGAVTPQQAAAIEATYVSAAIAAQAAYPEFEQVLAETKELLPQPVLNFIKTALPNGPVVALYLANHPVECARINDLYSRGFLTKAQRYTEKLSDQLAIDGSMGMDKDDYRTYRQKRNYQIRTRV